VYNPPHGDDDSACRPVCVGEEMTGGGFGPSGVCVRMRRRIVICLGLLFVGCLLGDTAAMLFLARSMRTLGSLAEAHRIQWLRANLSSDGVRVQTDLVSFLAGHPHSREVREENVQRFTHSLNHCRGCHHPPELTADFDSLDDSLSRYETTAASLYQCTEPQQVLELRQTAARLADRFVEQTTEMADRADKHLAASEKEVRASIHNAWGLLSATLLTLLIGSGAVALHLKRKLTSPVEALLDEVDRARHGDLSHPFPDQADDEFRVLASAFKQAYADLSTAKDGILNAEKLAATGQLAAGVAHEVLNPLASISSIAQMMRRRCESEQQREQAKLIETETARIADIVRGLLLFSRPAGKENCARIDIGPLLQHATTLIGYDPRARQVDVVRRIDRDLPAVYGDSQRLLLVFTNIMINALDAICANGGSGKVTVSAHGDNGSVVASFHDEGCGMGEHELKHAFDPFFTTKEAGAGTGMGLWVCSQVVHGHNGTIAIDSRVGSGTTITVKLPVDGRRRDNA